MNALPAGWKKTPDGRAIRREYVLSGFSSAVELIRKIAVLANAADHHPDLHLTRYRRLEIVLSTHSAGGVTDKDFALAAQIEVLPKKTGLP